MIVQLQDE